MVQSRPAPEEADEGNIWILVANHLQVISRFPTCHFTVRENLDPIPTSYPVFEPLMRPSAISDEGELKPVTRFQASLVSYSLKLRPGRARRLGSERHRGRLRPTSLGWANLL